jgi:glycosyltransferase involved in cell wall biosynthesis
MKLLIITQAVDENDSNLSFFLRWIEEFAKHCEKVMVICLREGQHHLPPNVKVFSLGKEKGASRLTRIMRFFKYIVRERNKYDAVFVHMNPEYVVLVGLFWRLWDKKIVLWYVHKSVDLKLRIATFFADSIATASKESFRLNTSKVHVMGHGIDTDFFTPDATVVRGDWWLSVGRLSKSKRHDVVIREAAHQQRELHIAGSGPELGHLEALVRELHANVQFLGGLSQTQLRNEYRRAALLIHTSETGSMDKVVLEALACGLHVRTNNPALKALEGEDFAYVREHHSLQHLIPLILGLYK